MKAGETVYQREFGAKKLVKTVFHTLSGKESRMQTLQTLAIPAFDEMGSKI